MKEIKIKFSHNQEMKIAISMQNVLVRFLRELNSPDVTVTIKEADNIELQVPYFMQDQKEPVNGRM